MATRDPLAGIARELRQYGLTVKKVPGWKTRGRPGGVAARAMFEHHTGSNRNSGNAPALGIVTNGRPDLEGPLANFLAGRDATIYLVAAGRCNHAGEGGPLKGLPRDSANAYSYAVEIENDGVGEPYDPDLMRAVAILTAVVLRRIRRTAYFSIGHKEWTTRKIDPSFAMKLFRNRVRHWLRRLRKGKG